MTARHLGGRRGSTIDLSSRSRCRGRPHGIPIILTLPLACPAQNPPDWQEILTHFRGSELQNYFQKILEDDLKAIIKPQYVDNIPKAVR